MGAARPSMGRTSHASSAACGPSPRASVKETKVTRPHVGGECLFGFDAVCATGDRMVP
jgi:hypothetical protein